MELDRNASCLRSCAQAVLERYLARALVNGRCHASLAYSKALKHKDIVGASRKLRGSELRDQGGSPKEVCPFSCERMQ